MRWLSEHSCLDAPLAAYTMLRRQLPCQTLTSLPRTARLCGLAEQIMIQQGALAVLAKTLGGQAMLPDVLSQDLCVNTVLIMSSNLGLLSCAAEATACSMTPLTAELTRSLCFC